MVECLQNIVKHGDEYVSLMKKETNTAIFHDRQASKILTSSHLVIPIKDDHIDNRCAKGWTKSTAWIRMDLKSLYKEIIKSALRTNQ
jgi:hypothetical protein